jgi:hypothetical protein
MPDAKTTQPKTFLERDNWMRAVNASDLPRGARCLAFAIALHLNVKTGRCDPGHKALSEDTGISERSVRRFLELLERDGWFATKRRGHGNTNSYVLLRPASDLADQEPTRPASDLADQENYDRPVSAHMTGQFEQHDRPTGGRQKEKKSEKRKEEKKSQTQPPDFASRDSGQDATTKPEPKTTANGRGLSTDDPDADQKNCKVPYNSFPEFWSAFPKRVAKAQAAKAFAAAIKRGADPAAMIEGAKRYANERIAEEPTDERKRWKYTKDPATWINAECWLDETAPTGPVIDQDGNVIDTPPPRRSGPLSAEEAAAKILAEIEQEERES